MVTQNKRLYFIDAMRAWAILMMLQGHFIDGLLDPVFKDATNTAYTTWRYFRGITAPVFFTVSGFIFTYLLLRAPRQGRENPRLRKGLKRGVQLILIGYALRTNLFGILQGTLYPSFFLVDVLHCIGISLLVVIGFYWVVSRWNVRLLAPLLLVSGLALFLFEPLYKAWDYSWMPEALANYFTRANGSVFTLIPWVGYTLLGGFLSMAFRKYRQDRYLYLKSIAICLIAGTLLIRYASPFFHWAWEHTGIALFDKIVSNNYLFMRLGDVLLVFAVFMLLRGLMKSEVFLRIGQNTLSIYVIHFIVLYGSFTGLGLYQFFHHTLTPAVAIPGALAFMGLCTWAALWYDRNEARIKAQAARACTSSKAMLSDLGQRFLRA
ncbi:MAG: heparan-alpha-glucosaminide N-acetyltransferase domain-containing protein, partial [Robiginitalea sp.]|nr:heparan-alpha-glucosaminide N-acetyltransferase domain-containing protein [Robiginitalea sp.]